MNEVRGNFFLLHVGAGVTNCRDGMIGMCLLYGTYVVGGLLEGCEGRGGCLIGVSEGWV